MVVNCVVVMAGIGAMRERPAGAAPAVGTPWNVVVMGGGRYAGIECTGSLEIYDLSRVSEPYRNVRVGTIPTAMYASAVGVQGRKIILCQSDDRRDVTAPVMIRGIRLERGLPVEFQIPLTPRWHIESLDLSPDGKSVVYSSDGEVFWHDVSANEIKQLPKSFNRGCEISVSWEAKRVAVGDDEGNVSVFDAEMKVVAKYRAAPEAITKLQFCDDGKAMFVSWRTGDGGIRHLRVPLASGDDRQLVRIDEDGKVHEAEGSEPGRIVRGSAGGFYYISESHQGSASIWPLDSRGEIRRDDEREIKIPSGYDSIAIVEERGWLLALDRDCTIYDLKTGLPMHVLGTRGLRPQREDGMRYFPRRYGCETPYSQLLKLAAGGKGSVDVHLFICELATKQGDRCDEAWLGLFKAARGAGLRGATYRQLAERCIQLIALNRGEELIQNQSSEKEIAQAGDIARQFVRQRPSQPSGAPSAPTTQPGDEQMKEPSELDRRVEQLLEQWGRIVQRDVWMLLGRSFELEHDRDRALLAYERAIGIQKDYAPAQLGAIRAKLTGDESALLRTVKLANAALDPSWLEEDGDDENKIHFLELAEVRKAREIELEFEHIAPR